jgi:protein gp37
MPHENKITRTIPRSVARQMTGIEWTDFTGNPWIGCTRLPANSGGRSGCDICYAATFAENRVGVPWGAGAPRRLSVSFHGRMRRLDRLAAVSGMPFAVFSLSLGDWLDPEVDPTWRSALIDTVEACGHLTWLLLTHRPHLARKLLPSTWRLNPPQNMWPGVTVDHPVHGYRWAQHAEFWAHTRRAWISAEPLAASLRSTVFDECATIIFGGASNTVDPSWEFRPEWVEEAVDRYGPEKVFFKQFGEFRDGKRVGKKVAGRDLAGRIYDHTPWPRHRETLTAIA